VFNTIPDLLVCPIFLDQFAHDEEKCTFYRLNVRYNFFHTNNRYFISRFSWKKNCSNDSWHLLHFKWYKKNRTQY